MMFNCVFVTFPCGNMGQVWYLIVSIPDLCRLSYFTLLYSIGQIFTLVSAVVKTQTMLSGFLTYIYNLNIQIKYNSPTFYAKLISYIVF